MSSIFSVRKLRFFNFLKIIQLNGDMETAWGSWPQRGARGGHGRWLSATGIRDRQGPERTLWDSSERDFPGLSCLMWGPAGGRSESTFPGGKQACEHQARDRSPGDHPDRREHPAPPHRGGSVAGTVGSVFLLLSPCSTVTAGTPFASLWPSPRKGYIKLSKDSKIHKRSS